MPGIILALWRAIGSMIIHQLHGMTGIRILCDDTKKKNIEAECPA
jgi:hypothetical protein